MSVDEFGSSFACSTLVNGTTSGSISTWDTESGEKEVRELYSCTPTVLPVTD